MFLSCDSDTNNEGIFLSFVVTPSIPLAAGENLLADGSSLVDVRVVLNQSASLDRRGVIFKTSSGLFVENNTKSFTAKATYVDGRLTASAKIKVSTKPGKLTVTAEPEFDSPLDEFVFTQFLEVYPSTPNDIIVSTSGYGISGNYVSEVRVTGKLRNSKGLGVSEGYRVRFEDLKLPEGLDASGEFRELQNVTRDSSTVRAYYSTPIQTIGTQIKLQLTIEDENGQVTDKFGSKIITVNQ